MEQYIICFCGYCITKYWSTMCVDTYSILNFIRRLRPVLCIYPCRVTMSHSFSHTQYVLYEQTALHTLT